MRSWLVVRITFSLMRTWSAVLIGFTQDFHLGPKLPIIELPSDCSHPDLRGLVGTLFGSIFGENWSGVAVLKKSPFLQISS